MTITMKKQDLPTDPQQLADFLRLPSIDSLRKSIKRWKVVPGRFNRKHELLDYQINKIAEKYSQTGSNITKHQANIILEFFENNGFESGLSSDDSDYKLAESIGQETDSSETDRITTNFSRMKNRTAKRTRCVQADNGQPSGQDASKRTTDSQADKMRPSGQTKKNPQSIVFENQYLFLTMLGLICLIDGVAMSVIAKEVVGLGLIIQVFYFIAGAIVAYAALQNAYTLSKIPRKSWETNHAITWIVVFTVFQIILHGAATDSFRTWNDMISQGLISTGIPMATAGLSVLLFHKQNDKP